MTFTTESCDQNFVVFFYKIETTILGDESCDLLSILDQLDTDTFTNGRVRLLSLDTDLFKNDSFGVRSTTERIGLPSCSQVSLLIVEISPDLITAIFHMLTSSSESTGLTHFVLENLRSGLVKYQTGKSPM